VSVQSNIASLPTCIVRCDEIRVKSQLVCGVLSNGSSFLLVLPVSSATCNRPFPGYNEYQHRNRSSLDLTFNSSQVISVQGLQGQATSHSKVK
jgi:hypothetical protein